MGGKPIGLVCQSLTAYYLARPITRKGNLMKMTSVMCVAVLLLGATTLFAADDAQKAENERNMRAFPAAVAGQVRYVLPLPPLDDEFAAQVEIIVGKTVEVDPHNRFFFGGRIEAVNIEGWGFTRYVVSELGPMGGTQMAVDPNVPKVQRFVRIGGEPFLVRYNSRLPIVVYAPEGVEVTYRVWRADPQTTPMPKG